MKIWELLKYKGEIIHSVPLDTPILDAVETMNKNRIGALVIKEKDGSAAGIMTERDILLHMKESFNGTLVKDIMTPKEKLIFAHKEDTVEYVLKVFTVNQIRHLPIFEKDRLIGLISIGDAVKGLFNSIEFENKLLKDYILGSYPIVP